MHKKGKLTNSDVGPVEAFLHGSHLAWMRIERRKGSRVYKR